MPRSDSSNCNIFRFCFRRRLFRRLAGLCSLAFRSFDILPFFCPPVFCCFGFSIVTLSGKNEKKFFWGRRRWGIASDLLRAMSPPQVFREFCAGRKTLRDKWEQGWSVRGAGGDCFGMPVAVWKQPPFLDSIKCVEFCRMAKLRSCPALPDSRRYRTERVCLTWLSAKPSMFLTRASQ